MKPPNLLEWAVALLIAAIVIPAVMLATAFAGPDHLHLTPDLMTALVAVASVSILLASASLLWVTAALRRSGRQHPEA
ncbi:hypothetical protein V6N00_13130 [Tersicoccus sp. MR15.9]|uniref:hypothetical protein n=1 Tax=Tersicoccus mangrovi TaxID=3121635 RepID=UPI002FE6B641